MIAYHSIQIHYVTEETQVGEQTRTLPNVAVYGETKLRLVQHQLRRSISVDSISIDPANPFPGSQSTISAIVKNTGDFVEENVRVSFFDSDSLIEEVSVADPLIAGATAMVEATWEIPLEDQSRRLVVSVQSTAQPGDPGPEVTAEKPVVLPDLAIASVRVERVTAETQMIIANIINDGAVTSGDATVLFRVGPADGDVIKRISVPALFPGAGFDASCLVTGAPDSDTNATAREFYIQIQPADSTQDFEPANNISSVKVLVRPGEAQPPVRVRDWAQY